MACKYLMSKSDINKKIRGKKVSVHFNFHKKCWSVIHKGRVVFHAKKVTLLDSDFKVSKSGYERAKSEGRKNVHAKVVGTLMSIEHDWLVDFDIHKFSYNYQKFPYFYKVGTKQKIEAAYIVHFTDNGAYYA